MNDYKSLAEKEIFNLSSSAQDFFHIIYGFDQNEIITNCVNVWILKDTIQMDTTITCGPFQLYFYENLFFLDEHSKLQNYKKLTNIALETLLKRFFTLNREKNEQILIEYIRQRQIKMTWPTLTALHQSPVLVYPKLVTLYRFSLWGEKKDETETGQDETVFW